LETIKKYFRVDHRKIGFLKFILEGYDGIATLTTVDPGQGLIVLYIAPGCEKDVDMVINSLAENIMIKDEKNIIH